MAVARHSRRIRTHQPFIRTFAVSPIPMAGLRNLKEQLKDAGISPGSTFERIVYNRSSDTIIVHFRRGRAGSLYYRKREDVRYRKIRQLARLVRYDHMVSASAVPLVLVNAVKARADSDGSDWLGVARLDLRTKKLEAVFCEQHVRLSRPYSGGWVRELLESWPDGRGVICVMGFSRLPSVAEREEWLVKGGRGTLMSVGEHWICDLDLEEKTFKRLVQLKAMYY